MTPEILILTLFFLFALNTPIAIAIGTASIAAIVFQGDFSPMIVVQRMVSGTDSFHLMAVPLFMYAGVIMEKGGFPPGSLILPMPSRAGFPGDWPRCPLSRPCSLPGFPAPPPPMPPPWAPSSFRP